MENNHQQYYCISCNQIHANIDVTNSRIFKTGYQTLSNGQKIHIGNCNTSHMKLSSAS